MDRRRAGNHRRQSRTQQHSRILPARDSLRTIHRVPPANGLHRSEILYAERRVFFASPARSFMVEIESDWGLVPISRAPIVAARRQSQKRLGVNATATSRGENRPIQGRTTTFRSWGRE